MVVCVCVCGLGWSVGERTDNLMVMHVSPPILSSFMYLHLPYVKKRKRLSESGPLIQGISRKAEWVHGCKSDLTDCDSIIVADGE